LRWIEYRVFCDQAAIDAVADLFQRLGSGGAAVEELRYAVNNPALEAWAARTAPPELGQQEFWLVKGYFPEAAAVESALRTGLKAVEANFSGPLVLEAELLVEEIWQDSWRSYYHTLKIGRLVVKPSWEEYLSADGEVVLELDPGMAFGTGLHPTTRFCLQLLEKYVPAEAAAPSVIDCGSGSGILAIAAARLGAGCIWAVDLEEEAVKVTRENVAANHLTDRVTVKEANAVSILRDKSFDLIIANLTADILLKLIPAAQAALPAGGRLIGSGVWHERWAEVQAYLSAAGLATEDVLQEEGWVGFAAYRPA
jgi:ribosomal protein L11 methyltransferase